MSTADDIKALLSRSVTDWEVTVDEEAKIVNVLAKEPDVSRVVRELQAAGVLNALVERVDEDATRPILMQILGGRADASLVATLRPIVQGACDDDDVAVFEACSGLQDRFSKLGLVASGAPFNVAPFAGVVGVGPSAPFGGSGATGKSPIEGSVPRLDQARMLVGNSATIALYSNPIPGDLPTYLATLSPPQRAAQATLLLRRQIVTIYPFSYDRALPTRADILRVAGRAHNLEPALIAGLVLAEQRDQSSNEDAKDYTAAVSLKRANTSIGLGQVVVSTTTRNDLFADLLPVAVRAGLHHKQVAKYLTSDEFNLFAVARYARKVANDGSRISIALLPETQAEFPGIRMATYAQNSRAWPRDNISALGSEYTSKAWDDHLSPGWGDFVLNAYDDIKASGVF